MSSSSISHDSMPSPRPLEDSEHQPSAKHVQPFDKRLAPDPVAPRSPLNRGPPVHPIPCMQAAFDESIMEYSEAAFSYVKDKLDAHARRQQLLEDDTFGDQYSARWRQKPGSKFHPLWKLVAQISFGVHLLHQRTAKSDHEVVKILQTHVDEVDCFLEDTMADFDLATSDIEERIEYLIMPLHNGRTFEKMLSDRVFRSAILDGNDVIEKIIIRTTGAMGAALEDVSNGIEATAELAKYLDRLGSEWTLENDFLVSIYAAMRANAEGWYACFKSIQLKGEHLRLQCSVLDSTVSEVSRRCGIVSRRGHSSTIPNRKSQRNASNDATKASRPSKSRMSSSDKPLPPDPLTKALAARVSHHGSEATSTPSEQPFLTPSPDPQRSKETPLDPGKASITPKSTTPTTTPRLKANQPGDTRSATTIKPTLGTSHSLSPVLSSVNKNGTSSPSSTKSAPMVDSAYSSGTNSVATSPKTKSQEVQARLAARPALQHALSTPVSAARLSTVSQGSLTAVPQVSGIESQRQQDSPKTGFGSLKSMFLKKHAMKEKLPSSGASAGGVKI